MIPETERNDVIASSCGHASYRGEAAELHNNLLAGIEVLSRKFNACNEIYGPLIPVEDLDSLGYLTSFPHQATVATGYRRDETNLNLVAARGPDRAARRAEAALEPIEAVLTPAACYHVYLARRDTMPDATEYIWTTNTCFRREDTYSALRRQSSFTMSELVCVGARDETDIFLDTMQRLIECFAARLGFRGSWEPASDPFFGPGNEQLVLMAKISPVKHEFVVDGLAISSCNRHNDHFTSSLGIGSASNRLETACAAFGIDRWIGAVMAAGATGNTSPDPVAAAYSAIDEVYA